MIANVKIQNGGQNPRWRPKLEIYNYNKQEISLTIWNIIHYASFCTNNLIFTLYKFYHL